MEINNNQNINTDIKTNKINSSCKNAGTELETVQNVESEPSFCRDENLISEINSESKAESNISFVEETETKPKTTKYSIAVDKVAEQLRKATTPEEKTKILDSFKRSLNFTRTEPNMGVLGEGIGVFSITTRYENPRLRPFVKYAKSEIPEANKSENDVPSRKPEADLYKQIIKAVREARRERWKEDSPPDKYSFFKV